MKRSYAPILGGALLILAGIAFLLNNFGIFDLSALWAGLWVAIFLVGGVASCSSTSATGSNGGR